MARPGRYIAPCLGLRVMGRTRGAGRLGMHQGVLTVVARPEARRVARCVVQRSLLLAVECMTRVLHVRPSEREACMHAVFACRMARERKTSATLRTVARNDGGTDDFWFHAAALPPHQPSGGRRRHHIRRPMRRTYARPPSDPLAVSRLDSRPALDRSKPPGRKLRRRTRKLSRCAAKTLVDRYACAAPGAAAALARSAAFHTRERL